jgi:hypothetical protein
LAVVQLLPFPDSVLGSLAPIAAPAWKLAHQGIPDVSGSISVYPEATAAGLRHLLLGLALIVMVADLSRDARLRQWLLWALAAVGLLIWMLGLIFPGLLAYAGWRTAKARSMESSTGLLYICLGAVATGTILAAGLFFGAGIFV